MKKLLIALSLLHFSAHADLSGSLTLQAEHYIDDPLNVNQLENDVSISVSPKYFKLFNNGNDRFSIEGFGRIGSQDDEKNHLDIRELSWLHLDGDYEWRLGINTVFWGVTEAQNLVDVINQKDAVEGIDNEKKLGQPMLHFTAVKDWGIIDAHLLFGFRERTYAGIEGRPRTPLVVDTDNAQYESSDKEKHLDIAIRYSHYYEDIDYAVSYFNGTQREPILSPITVNGALRLQPYYRQISQVGIEAQTIIEAWLWKFEGILVTSDSGNHSAFTGGFEYSFYGIFDSATDLGTIAEILYDSREQTAPTAFNQDLFLGARFTFNDIQSSSILAGMIFDVDNHTRLLRIEAERRLGDAWKLSAEMQIYGHIADTDVLKAVENDNAFNVELSYFF